MSKQKRNICYIIFNVKERKRMHYFCPAAPGLGKDICVSADSCKTSGTFGVLFLRVLFIA